MRGDDANNGSMFSYIDLEKRISTAHPLRVIREIANAALKSLSRAFDGLYSEIGRESVPPERVMRALLLQAFYSIRSERQLVERINTDLLFRWFVGLGIEDPVWDATTFTKNRDRLLDGEVAAKFLTAVLSHDQVKGLLSSEHFSVDGTLLEAWAMAIEVVRRVDALFDIERPINGKSAEERRVVRQKLSKPLVEELQVYMREQRTKLSRGHALAKAIDYILKRWAAFTLFLDDGRVCLSNNAAERALRGIALGRRSWMFCGSDRGGQRAAALYSLIVTAKMNNIDPQAWLADILARIAGHPAHRLDELLPWNLTPTAFPI